VFQLWHHRLKHRFIRLGKSDEIEKWFCQSVAVGDAGCQTLTENSGDSGLSGYGDMHRLESGWEVPPTLLDLYDASTEPLDIECLRMKGLTFIHINIRSLLPTLDAIRTLSLTVNTQIAVIGITKTWLDESVTHSVAGIPGYKYTYFWWLQNTLWSTTWYLEISL